MTSETISQTVLFPELLDKLLVVAFDRPRASSDRGAVGLSYDIYRPWRLSLPCCFLAGDVFPPCHRHIDVGRLDLEREDAPPLLLKCRQGPSCRPFPLTGRRRALRQALRHRTGRNGPDSLQRNTRSASG